MVWQRDREVPRICFAGAEGLCNSLGCVCETEQWRWEMVLGVWETGGPTMPDRYLQ